MYAYPYKEEGSTAMGDLEDVEIALKHAENKLLRVRGGPRASLLKLIAQLEAIKSYLEGGGKLEKTKGRGW